VQSLRTKVAQQGADVRAWFRLEGSKNTRLELAELEDVLRRAKARPGQRELASIFRLLDAKKDGRVDTNEFCDVLEGKQIPDYEAYVRAQR
jgi:Ca2+-binding EF-hand superfamily protein